MPEFCSFLVFEREEIDLVHSICATAKWSTRDISDPSMRYSFSESGMTKLAQAKALKDIDRHRQGQQGGRLLLLEAEQAEADNIIQLVCAANVVVEAFPFGKSLPTCAIELTDDDADRQEIFESVFQKDGFFQRFTYRPTMPVAVAIAAKAWHDKKLVYAIHKLAYSYETESVTPWSMHPFHGQKFEKHTNDFASHVGTSVAINLAYSAIEELGLGVRASTEKKRNIGEKTFIWNPEVLEPFKDRLQRAGVEPNSTIDWVTRGNKTEIDIYKMIDQPSDHFDGVEVRDRSVSVHDAINFCEYLRNTKTAHAFSEETPLLGPYEVYNVQQVARFLILSKCNLWSVSTEDLHRRYG